MHAVNSTLEWHFYVLSRRKISSHYIDLYYYTSIYFLSYQYIKRTSFLLDDWHHCVLKITLDCPGLHTVSYFNVLKLKTNKNGAI